MPWVILEGDCIEVMRANLRDASVDAIVCDPPAGISFMNRTWDRPGVLGVSGGVAMPTTTASRNPSCRKCGGRKRTGPATKACECADGPDWNDIEYRHKDRAAFVGFLPAAMAGCLRVLKPGGHAFVWALPRTAHWTAWAVEEAGFEIRDVVTHVFGTGFPKSTDRKRIPPGWKGWNTALKPAAENWILARKPLVGTVAANILKHGAGALNVDACRVGTSKRVPSSLPKSGNTLGVDTAYGTYGPREFKDGQDPTIGRFPPNFLLSHAEGCVRVGEKKVKSVQRAAGSPGFGVDRRDNYRKGEGRVYGSEQEMAVWACEPKCPVAALDAQSGILRARGNTTPTRRNKSAGVTGWGVGHEGPIDGGNTDGASRFFPTFAPDDDPDDPLNKLDFPGFYCAKAARSEREAGLDGLPARTDENLNPYKTAQCRVCGSKSKTPGQNAPGPNCGHDDWEWVEQTGGRAAKQVRCTHPTVKPIALMKWLCRLVTPPGGLILDPFAGSGTTGIAAVLEGFRFLGIEKEPEYVTLARARIKHRAGTDDALLGENT